MNANKYVLVLTFVLICTLGTTLAQGDVIEELGIKAAEEAMAQLGFEKGDENILVMTDAGYAVIDDQITLKAVKGITETCGCNIGDGNLLRIQRSKFNPLWFFFFNKESGEALFLQVKNGADLSGEDFFETESKEVIAYDAIMSNQEEWGRMLKDKVFSGNEFSLVSIANIWALPDADYTFLQATCLHNHLCPGVTSGQMIANYVEKELPINDPKNQSYKVITCPVWCKDDYFQVVWDATPGKKGMYVKYLSEDETNALTAKYGTRPAGIYTRWNGATNTGDGLVVGFDWDKTYELTGTGNWTGNGLLQKLTMDMEMAKFANQPELVVSTIKEVHFNSTAEFNMLGSAGVNPLKVLGIEG